MSRQYDYAVSMHDDISYTPESGLSRRESNSASVDNVEYAMYGGILNFTFCSWSQ